MIGPKPSIIHIDAIKGSVISLAMSERNVLVGLWTMGSHVQRLMGEHMMYPDDIAAQTGVAKASLYSALTVRETYATLSDIP
jgi:hypothetical protein